MHTHTTLESTAQLLSSKNPQAHILLHHVHKAHFKCHGCPNASLLRPKPLSLHIIENQDHPVAHPLENLTNLHNLQSFVDP